MAVQRAGHLTSGEVQSLRGPLRDFPRYHLVFTVAFLGATQTKASPLSAGTGLHRAYPTRNFAQLVPSVSRRAGLYLPSPRFILEATRLISSSP